ncbi:cupin domain-containing protein [Parasphingopyxis algicola]|uniref:cupin domain-containing protein n=1 Tax=Parasphingopyxis algicola TaxID=2026624 RepID=UPI0015A46A59|nr:cupin domain-containing protein [Parasphingopyxis algicola]QLC23832.1 cupin domain-containing protein [Parasphingopyxis algicola]
MRLLLISLPIGLCAAAAPSAAHDSHHAGHAPVKHTQNDDAEVPPPGSNQRLRAPITIAEGLEVIISDVVIPAGAAVPRHYHPGEEFLYVLEGSAVHVQEGQADITLSAGDSYVIPPRAIHSPRGGPDGARAVVFRVHVDGQPERILVPEE